MVISVLRWVILACHLRIMWNFSCTIYLVVFDISLESLFLSFSQQRMQNEMGLEYSRRIRGWRYGLYPEMRSRFRSRLIKISHEDHVLFLVPRPWIFVIMVWRWEHYHLFFSSLNLSSVPSSQPPLWRDWFATAFWKCSPFPRAWLSVCDWLFVNNVLSWGLVYFKW